MGATRNEKGEFLHVCGCSHLVCHLLPPSLCLLVTGFWAVADKISGSLIVVENTPWYAWKYWYLPDSLSLLHVNNSTVHQTAGCPYLSLSLSLSLCISVNVGLFSLCVCGLYVCGLWCRLEEGSGSSWHEQHVIVSIFKAGCRCLLFHTEQHETRK